MKKWVTVITVLVLSTSPVWAKSQPGKRPDLAPSKLMRIIFGSSLEDKIIQKSKTVKERHEKWEKIPYSKKKGLPFFRYRPKDRVLEELEEQKDALKDLLASTPADANVTKSEVISKNTDEPKNANVEAIEVKFSLENTRNLVRQGRRELMADPTNLEIATKYYEAHVACLATIIEMNDEFIQNIDIKYGTAIDKLIKKLEALLKKSEERMHREFENDQVRERTKQIKANQEKVLKALREVRSTRLPNLKDWAKNKIPQLSERLEVARLANETLHVTREAKALIEGFGSDYEKLAFPPPPLIVFEVDLSKFELPQ